MFIRVLFIAMLGFTLVGCVTTQSKTNLDQLQVKVVELEQKLEEKDTEIVDLKYEVKDLAAKIEASKSSASPSSSSSTMIGSSATNDGIIKVGVSGMDVQTALKNAGFYHGAVDGKIGSQTKKAVASFQKSRNLTADGVVGKRTWEELKTFLQ